MNRRLFIILLVCLACSSVCFGKNLVWEIGQKDNSAAEFLEGPGKEVGGILEGFYVDGVYVVGVSDPKKDWPYIHPGNLDTWAHIGLNPAYNIAFDLAEIPEGGSYQLEIDMVETNPYILSKLKLSLNGALLESVTLPKGGIGGAWSGQLAGAIEYVHKVSFSSDKLKLGTNVLTIENFGYSSWIVYDYLALTSSVPSKVGTPDLSKNKEILSVGKNDNRTDEFYLGPEKFSQYKNPGFFVPGSSEIDKHWPYVHPGPDDNWAAGKSRLFTIVFDVEGSNALGYCKLNIRVGDSHKSKAPAIAVKLNGKTFARQLPNGTSTGLNRRIFTDEECNDVEFIFPASFINNGRNRITIETLTGSWFIYDVVSLEAPQDMKLSVYQEIFETSKPVSNPVLIRRDDKLMHLIEVPVLYSGKSDSINVTLGENYSQTLELIHGEKVLQISAPRVTEPTEVTIEYTVDGNKYSGQPVTLKPVREWEFYYLPHSHSDLLWLREADQIYKDMWEYVETSIDAAEKTKGYGPDAQYKWNVEVLYAFERYLREADEEKKQKFINAVKEGIIGLDAFFGGPLTALPRPEELGRQFNFAHKLNRDYGLNIDSAMICDVPGFSWGTIAAAAHSGIKYVTSAVNPGDPWHKVWADRPSYYLAPDGKSKVLFWVAGKGYVEDSPHRPVFNLLRTEDGVADFFDYLEYLQNCDHFPYSITSMHACSGDQMPPMPELAEVVKRWNEKYAYPRIIISTTSKMFHAFEDRYGDQLPEITGDYTGYWEDGVASSARETGLSRMAAEKLVQAETLYAMESPDKYDDEAFQKAWQNVLMYSEHSWGAFISITNPEASLTKSLWNTKKGFAENADKAASEFISDAISSSDTKKNTIEVYNTLSWDRSDIVYLSPELSEIGDKVLDAEGGTVISQRLSTGQLAILAENVPAFGTKRFTISSGKSHFKTNNTVSKKMISTDQIKLKVSDKTGAIISLKHKSSPDDLVESLDGRGLNGFVYIANRDAKNPLFPENVDIKVKETGPLVCSLLITSKSQGTKSISQEIIVLAPLGRVDIINELDKLKILEKETVFFEFPFNVSNGQMNLDFQWAIVRPGIDQLRGSVKNSLCINRWADVSNEKSGITWVTLEAPYIEIGPLKDSWDNNDVGPTQRINSLVMTNRWHCNYRAFQQGFAKFRYSIIPHGSYNSVFSTKAAIERSQPLISTPAVTSTKRAPLLKLSNDNVIATAFKLSHSGGSYVLRLWNPGDKSETCNIDWMNKKPKMWISDFSEEKGAELQLPLELLPKEIMTVLIKK